MMMKPKQLGLLAIILFTSVIVIEGGLSLVRQRLVTAYIDVRSNLPTPTPIPSDQPTPLSGSDTSVGDLRLSTDGAVIVTVQWDYRIGPTFPNTHMWVNIYNSQQQVVATQNFWVICRGNTLECRGSQQVELRYGQRITADTSLTATPQIIATPATAWPVGRYTVEVTRNYASFEPIPVASANFSVEM